MRTCKRGHPRTPENTYRGQCRPCKTLAVRRVRERAAPAPDGLEDEYGPVPPRAAEADWHDWAAVDRAMFGPPPDRALTPSERAEWIKRTMHLPDWEVATTAGVDVRDVQEWRCRV